MTLEQEEQKSTNSRCKMKVVALISGGKDSCYAMMKCIEYGHQVVALANLIPPDDSVDELDSYMYQTVGHQLVACYAECMGLPLFRRRIKGSSRHCKLNYTETEGDEVEDLFALLKAVKEQMPFITGVSSGAIASDYQRLRVESICSRLGLVSLAYLWKKDQSLLLNEMITNGVAAITVKVASMGLDPAKHLGKDIAYLEPHLHSLNKLYGVNVCGEGGEYETLTLDCPLFCNYRIVLDKFQIISHSSDSIAPVGVIHPQEFHLEKKPSSPNETEEIKTQSNVTVLDVDDDPISAFIAPKVVSEISIVHDRLASNNKRSVFSLCSSNDASNDDSRRLEDDLISALKKMETQLNALGYNWSNVLYIHLFIADMSEFSKANEIYVKFITQQRCPFGVPSRSTVELPLSEAGSGKVIVEALVANGHCKDVLHVQSISSWAPSCIGPYSQATLHKEVLHMAGQLGLDPSTMSLHGLDPNSELDQALKNCESVANCFDISISTSSLLFTVYCSRHMASEFRQNIHEKIIAFFNKLTNCATSEPMFLYLLVSGLPKSALLELKPILSVSNDFQTTRCKKLEPPYTALFCRGFQPVDWHSCIQSCVSNKVCALLVCVTSEQAEKICANYEDAAKLSRFCVHILHESMLESDFSWESVMTLRIYFRASSVMKREELCSGFRSAMMEISESNPCFAAASETAFAVVPVMAAGTTSSMDAVIACELLANKC